MSNMTYNNTPELKFWCQKALPLVYDDSLSYYEVLCKVVAYLNSTTEDVRNLIDEVNGIIIDLENVAIIDDSVVAGNYVWSSQKVVDYVPKILDNVVANNSIWSSQKTREDIEAHITNNGTTWTTKAYSTKYVQDNFYEKLAVDNRLANKVDKVAGKGLSTNDYTDADKAIVDSVTSALAGKVDTSAVGANNGVASLGSDGKVPASQLPSYVDDVLEYSSVSAFPATGDSGKIYVALDTNKTYRWSGSAYVEISESLALGETASTAYAGNKGKQNADNIATLQGYVPSGTSSSNKLVNATELANGLSGKQDTLTFDNTPTANSNNPVKSGGVYNTLSDKVSWDDAGKSVKKNLCKNIGTSQTINGITYTVNSDGSVLVNGTNTHSTAGAWFKVNDKLSFKGGDVLTISGIPSGAGNDIAMFFRTEPDDGNVSNTYTTVYTGQEKQVTIPSNFTEDNKFVLFINVPAGKTASNVLVKPMIRLASILDNTYEPYIPDNTELMSWEDNGMLGAKNLLRQYGNGYTHLGVTYTIGESGVIYANGTATGGVSVFNVGTFDAKLGKSYTLSSNVNSDSATTHRLWAQKTNDTSSDAFPLNHRLGTDTSENKTRQALANETVKIVIQIMEGQTVDNLAFYPMVRFAEDTDDTYVPYAMTNRELTKQTQKLYGTLLTDADNLDNIVEDGWYSWGSSASAPSNRPDTVAWSCMRVVTINNYKKLQIIYTNTSIYIRAKEGSPIAWTSWYKFTGTIVS